MIIVPQLAHTSPTSYDDGAKVVEIFKTSHFLLFILQNHDLGAWSIYWS